MNHSDPFDLQSQDKAAADNSDKAKLAQQVEIDDLKWQMSDKRGRRNAFRDLERAGVWRISFNSNALTMAFNEGMRNHGLRKMALLTTHCAERYAEMLKESKDE